MALAGGDIDEAGMIWGAADSEASRLPSWEDERRRRAGALIEETEPEFLAAYEHGRQLDLWDAAAIALGKEDQTVP